MKVKWHTKKFWSDKSGILKALRNHEAADNLWFMDCFGNYLLKLARKYKEKMVTPGVWGLSNGTFQRYWDVTNLAPGAADFVLRHMKTLPRRELKKIFTTTPAGWRN